MKKWLSGFVLASGFVLQACGGASERQVALQDGVPLVNIIKEPSGKETVLIGKIQPRMNFTSSFSSRSESGIECAGEFTNQGVGAISCTNGWKMNVEIPRELYGTLNGNYIQTENGIGAAIGWGRDADVELLRSLM